MKIIHDLAFHPANSSAAILTIGNFDGFHIGHQAVIKRVIEVAHQQKKTAAVITFENHPSQVLRANSPVPLLCTAAHKLLLLQTSGIDLTAIIPFTKTFSEQTAEEFLYNLRHTFPFTTLIFGSDGHIGKDRQGDRTTVAALANKMNFSVEYFPDCLDHGQRISSSIIREHISKGELTHASELLGRPYSIYAQVVKGCGRGDQLGYPTSNILVEGLCHPPLGVYAVELVHKGIKYPAVANLGIAPTLRNDSIPLLEVHIYDERIDLCGEFIEVIFKEHLRSERKFSGIEELKQQIALDIAKAKNLIA